MEEGPMVETRSVSDEGSVRQITIQGEALPYMSTQVYAKVSGFLRNIYVDKGASVNRGDLLASIESQEIDRDTLALKTDAENKRAIAERSRALGREGYLSPQDAEQAETNARIAEAKYASQSTVRGYQEIRAPFSGKVIQRYVDTGALIQNGGASSSAQPLLTLAQVDHLRVVFYLDSRSAMLVKVGDSVTIKSSDRPDLVRKAKVSRINGALDARTRTLLVEADMDNSDSVLLPGSYVLATLDLPHPSSISIPPEAVVFQQGRPMAFVLRPGGRVALHALTLGEEQVGRINVLAGVRVDDRVVVNPPMGLKDEDRIRAADQGR